MQCAGYFTLSLTERYKNYHCIHYTKFFFIIQKRKVQKFKEMEHWHIRNFHDSNGGVLLQFYGSSYQNKDWKEFGWFFIVNVDESGTPTFELGDYETAEKKGIFKIDS